MKLFQNSPVVLDSDNLVVCIDVEEHIRLSVYDTVEKYVNENDTSNINLIVIGIAEAFLQMDRRGPFSFFTNIAKCFKHSTYINANIHIQDCFKRYTWFKNNFDALYCYPYAFNNRTIHRLKALGDIDKVVDYDSMEPDRHAIFYNAVPLDTRAFLIDRLHKTGSIENTYYSWLLRKDFDPEVIKDWDDKIKFFDWRNPKILDVELSQLISGISQDKVDNDLYFNKTIFELAVETCPGEYELMYTEKTWKPLLMGKVFFILGSHEYYKNLRDMGFELYDEIFDYSFDSIVDLNERLDMFHKTLEKVLTTDINIILDKVRSIKEKILYNKNLALSIDTKDPIIDRYKFFNKDQMTK
jgi:hypothetical protein